MLHASRLAALVAALLAAVASASLAQEMTHQAGADAYNAAMKLYNDKDYPAAGKALENFVRVYIGHPNRNTAAWYAVLSYYYARWVST